ncbi:MAG: hypothetical protein L6V90_02620 [Treponema succinifaciens]|uniref:DUF7723 family protein n=1 Tax=Treponema succinifaciens TaxID=167 RepID=UPI0023F00852|nr:hypothetical protein [Treponema succinifaciens]UKI56095.1 MAG: hypothetical protein L6V90_02620 [Treponema succinifaciens]
MPQNEIEKIAAEAKFIIAGYSFSLNEENQIRVLNLENPTEAAVLTKDGDLLETTMDDAKLALVQSYYLKNKEFIEE